MTSFNNLWNRNDEFTIPEEKPNLCVYAQKFSEFTEPLCANAARTASVVAVNQAKVLLLDKYWEWYRVVPLRHRSVGSLNGRHTCIFGVFELAYNRLKLIELALTPPMLFLPAPLPPVPPPPPPPQIAGIFIGEIEGE
jgi:hypothetical protein